MKTWCLCSTITCSSFSCVSSERNTSGPRESGRPEPRLLDSHWWGHFSVTVWLVDGRGHDDSPDEDAAGFTCMTMLCNRWKQRRSIDDLAGLEYTTRFLPWFSPDFTVWTSWQASWGKSEPVRRLQLTDSTENLVVYYGHRLRFFSFRLWLYPVGEYQTLFDIFSVF